MKALITGINGFVGGYLSEYLIEQGVEVWGTKLPNELKSNELNENIIIRELNIIDKQQVLEIVNECRPDYIFHLAAQSSVALSWQNPRTTIDVNVNGTINLIESVKEINNDIRILLIGSSEEYGIINPNLIPINEEHPLEPTNPYAVSKMAQQAIAKQFVNAYGMNIVIVRAFNHIGPKQSPIFVVSDFAKRVSQMEKGILEPILYVGNLEAKRDFTDVRDIVRGYYNLIQQGKSGEVYNIGSGRSHKIKDMLDMVLKLAKIKIEIQQDASRIRPIDVPIIECDNSKLKDCIDWEIKYNMEQTIEDIMKYWRSTLI